MGVEVDMVVCLPYILRIWYRNGRPERKWHADRNLPRRGSIPRVRTKQNHYVLFKEKEIRQTKETTSKSSDFG
jgi:hypothetical protein